MTFGGFSVGTTLVPSVWSSYLQVPIEVTWNLRLTNDFCIPSQMNQQNSGMFTYKKCSMFRFITPSPRIPIPHNHKTITLPLAAFFFNHIIIDQPPKHEPEHNISITNNTSYWTKIFYRLCSKDRNVDEALHLLDCLNLHGYPLDYLNINTIIHALYHSNHFSEAHHHLLLFISFHCVPDERTCNVLIAKLLDS